MTTSYHPVCSNRLRKKLLPNPCRSRSKCSWWMNLASPLKLRKWAIRWVTLMLVPVFRLGVTTSTRFIMLDILKIIDSSLFLCIQPAEVLPDLVKFMDSIHGRIMTCHRLSGPVESEAGTTPAGKEFLSTKYVAPLLAQNECPCFPIWLMIINASHQYPGVASFLKVVFNQFQGSGPPI